MKVSNPELWGKISEFQIDDPASEFPLSARLARENGWGKGMRKGY
jgi:hypothetical protein